VGLETPTPGQSWGHMSNYREETFEILAEGDAIKMYNVTKPKPITVDEFFEQYKPVINHLDDNASFDGYMFETFGEEEAFVCTKSPEFIGTYCDGDNGTYIVSGYHLVNRIGYFITELPIPEDLCVTVSLDSDECCVDEPVDPVVTPETVIQQLSDMFISLRIREEHVKSICYAISRHYWSGTAMSAIIESSKVKEIQRLGDTPMWVVFWTTTIPSEIDEYKVVPSEQEAIKLY